MPSPDTSAAQEGKMDKKVRDCDFRWESEDKDHHALLNHRCGRRDGHTGEHMCRACMESPPSAEKEER